jgi:hypothetical protein
MRITRLIAAISAFTLAPAALFTAAADDFGHEYYIDLQTGDLASGKSGFGQGLGYAFYPVRVDTGDKPYAQAAFATQAHFVSVAIDGSSADRADGSAHNWNYAVKGRYTFPGNVWFGDAALSRAEYEFDPFVLSSSTSESSATTKFRLGGGMYFNPTTSLDLGVASSTSENKATPDVNARHIDLRGKTLLPVGNNFVAMEIHVTQSSAEFDNETLTSLDYDASFAWYFTRAVDMTIGFGTDIDPDYPLADYRTVTIGANWFVEPELLLAVKIERQTWWNDDQFDSLALRFGVRL